MLTLRTRSFRTSFAAILYFLFTFLACWQPHGTWLSDFSFSRLTGALSSVKGLKRLRCMPLSAWLFFLGLLALTQLQRSFTNAVCCRKHCVSRLKRKGSLHRPGSSGV